MIINKSNIRARGGSTSLLLTLLLCIGVLGVNSAQAQCVTNITLDVGDNTLFNDFTNDIVNGSSGNENAGPIGSDVIDGTPAVAADSDGTDDIDFSFEIINAFDVYGGVIIDANAGVTHDVRQESTGIRGTTPLGASGSNESSTGDVRGYCVTVMFDSDILIEAQDLDVNFSSINTAGEAYESAAIQFLNTSGMPFSGSTISSSDYTGFYTSQPSGTAVQPPISSAPWGSLTSGSGGVFLADDTNTIVFSGNGLCSPFDPATLTAPECGTDGPNDSPTVNAATDAGVTATDMVGGFKYCVLLEDVALTTNDGDNTTTSTTFTSTMTELNIAELCRASIAPPAGCVSSTGVCEGEDVTGQKTGGNVGTAGFNTIYYLVNEGSTTIVDLVDTDGLATFTTPAVGCYEIHVLNYDESDAPTALPLAIGDDIATVNDGCYDTTFLTDFICACVNPAEEKCEGDSFTAESTGATAGNELLYVLTDGAGSAIINTSLNPVGAADFTADVSAPNSYRVYALSYPAGDAPSFLPLGATMPSQADLDAATGCFNDDFLVDFICCTVNPLPTANAVTLELCESTAGGGMAMFTLTDAEDSSAGSNTSGTDVDNGTSNTVTYHANQADADAYDGTNPTPLASPYMSASGTIVARVEDGNGCYETVDITLTVNPLPVANAVTLELCESTAGGGMAMFTLTDAEDSSGASNTSGTDVDNGTSNTVTYHANQADADVYDGTNPTPLASPYMSGSGTIVARVEDGNGCYETVDITLTVNSLPTISDAPVCVGSTVSMVGSGTPASTTPYVSDDLGVATVDASGTVTGVGAGTANITYTDDNGCSSSALVTVTVCACTPTNVCSGDDITASLTGYTTDPGYALVFLLTDVSGNVLATSGDVVGTGTFNFSTTGLTAGTTYNIYGLSYDTTPGNIPDPLPINVGDDVNTIGTTTMGCYNSDFLSNYVCYTIENCCDANITDIPDQEVCEGSDPDLNYAISAFGTPFGPQPTPIADYSYAFFITDPAGNIIQLDGNSPIAGSSTSHIPDFDYSTLTSASSPYNVYFVIYNSAGGVTLVDEGNSDAAVAVGTNVSDLGTSDDSDCLEADFSTLQINALPTLTPYVTSVCADVTTVDLTSIEGNIGATGGSWTDNTSAAVGTSSAAPVSGSPFTYSYTDGNGCTSTTTATYNTDALPTATPSSITLCEDIEGSGMATFDLTTQDATVGGGDAVTWYVDAAFSSQILAPTTYVSGSGTVYAIVSDGTCEANTSVTLTVNTIPAVDDLADVSACDTYALPVLGNGTYYNGTGGTGGTLNAGDAITASTTIYIYAESGTVPNCTNETSFIVTISITPSINAIANVNACDSYDLSNITISGTDLTGNENLYESNLAGTGPDLSAPASGVITTSGTYWAYDATGTTPNCTDAVSFDVTIEDSADAGVNNTVCPTSSTIDLFASLGGTPDLGGVWTNPSGGTVPGGDMPTVTLSTAADFGDYTYTITPTTCPPQSAIVTVTLKPYAGEDLVIDVCIDDAPFDVLAALSANGANTGTVDAGGSWTSVASGSSVGTGDSFMFTPGVTAEGSYNYNVTFAGCPQDDAVVTINVLDPGTDGTLQVCTSDMATTSLFAQLGGTPDNGGTWTDPSNAAHSGTFDPQTDVAGSYTYTVTSNGTNCSSVVNVSFFGSVTANPAAISLCESVQGGGTATFDLTSVETTVGGGNSVSWYSDAALSMPISTSYVSGSTTVYAEVTDGNGCTASNSVTLTVNSIPAVDDLADVNACDVYALPVLGNGTYYNGTGGTGGTLNAGDAITASTIIYIYAESSTVPNCTNETSFTITINTTPSLNVIADVEACDSYDLSNITISGTNLTGNEDLYESNSAGTGPDLSSPASGVITSSGTYWAYDATGTTPDCSDATSFMVTIVDTPVLTVWANQNACNSYQLPTIGGTGLVSPMYYDLPGGPSGGGTAYPTGATITTTTTLYIYDVATGGTSTSCPVEVGPYTITIDTDVDPGMDAVVCPNGTTVDLFNSLNGTPDIGGTWTDPSNNPVAGGDMPVVNLASSTDFGTYTYTVSSTDCPDMTATVTVTLKPYAGEDLTIDVCVDDAPFDVLAALAANPANTATVDAGGTWTEIATSTSVGFGDNFTFIPGTTNAGSYNYSINTANCPQDDAVVTINVLDPGTDGTLVVCSSDVAPTNLFAQLGGSPTTGGVWTNPTAGTHSGMFDPTVDIAGTYIYTVSSGSASCFSMVDVSIETQPTAGTGSTVEVCDDDNGIIDLQATLTGEDSNGSWSDDNTTGALFGSVVSISDLPGAGSYTFTYTVAGTAQCPGDSEAITVNVTSVSADAGANQTLTCTITQVQLDGTGLASTGTVSYSWSGPGGFTSSDEDPMVSVAGTYTLTVTSDNNSSCTATSTVEVIEDIDQPDASAIGGTLTCANTLVQIFANSTTVGVVYTWSGPGGFTSNSQNPFVSVAGNYTVTVTNIANGCTNTAIAVVDEDITAPGASAVGGTLTCTTTSVEISADSPTTGVAYSWSGPLGYTSNDQSPTVSVAGTYTVTVTNPDNGCTSTANAIVDEDLTMPDVSATGGTLTCTNPTIMLTSSSSVAGATYLWSGPGGYSNTSQNPTVGVAGTYTVTVTDPSNGCTNSMSVNVDEDPALPGASATGGTLTCTNTTVNLSGSSPTTGVTFNWTTSDGNIVSQDGLGGAVVDATGTYTLTVTDPNNGCESITTVMVDDNLVDPIATADGGTLTCVINALNLSGSGSSSSGTVNYSWTGPGGFTSTDQNPLVSVAGTYTLTVTDPVNGCTSTDTAIVDEDLTAPGATATGGTLTCDVTSITLTGTSGTAGVTYSWSGPAGYSSTDQNPTVSTAGTYTLTVTNIVNGCTSTDTAIVDEDLTAPGVTATGGTLTCDVTSITLTANSGTAGVTYSWSGPAGFSSTIQNPIVSVAGTYTVTATNPVNGCTSTDTAVVDEDGDLPGATATGGTLTCTTTTINLVGTSPTAGVTFNWTTSDGNIVSQDGLGGAVADAAGTYTLTVTNSSNGCVSTANAIVDEDITEPGAIAVGGTLTCTTTSISLSGSSATAGVTYAWTGPAGFTSSLQNPSVSVSGTYTLTVTNPANGCTSTDTADVTADTTPPTVAIAGDSAYCEDTNGVTLDAGFGYASYLWSPNGEITQTITATAGTYTVTVTDPNNGCEATSASFTVTEEAVADAGTDGAVNLCNTDDTIDLFTFLGGTPQTGGTWSPALASGTSIFDPTIDMNGTYTYTVIGSVLCGDDSANVTVSINTPPDAGEDGEITLCDAGVAFNLFNVLEGNPQPGGNWSPALASGSGLFDPAVDAPGAYTYTVAGTGACSSSTAIVSVTVISQLNAGDDGSVTLCSSDGIVNLFTYLNGTPLTGGTWTPATAAGNGIFDPLVDAEGIYTYSVDNTFPCPASSAIVAVSIITCEDCAVVNPGTVNDLSLCNTGGGDLPTMGTIMNTGDEGGVWTVTPNVGGAFNSATGEFNAVGLAPGDYVVSYLISNPDLIDGTVCPDGLAVGVVTVTECDTCPLEDVVATPGMCVGSASTILGFVGYDANDDQDINFGEPGIEGITVNLYTAGTDGQFGTADDVLVDTDVTDSTGSYSFVNLTGGTYFVDVDAQSPYLVSFDDAAMPVTIGQGNSYDLSINVESDGSGGSFSVILDGMNIGSYNYTGTNTLVNVPMMNANGQAVSVQIIDDASGNCIVTDTYNAPDPCNNGAIFAETGLNGFGSISNYVWFDTDADGVQDPNEDGVGGIQVILYDANGTQIATTVTDEDGYYYFINLPLGDYEVQFIIPEIYEVTTQDNGAEDLDSDVGSDGYSGMVSIVSIIDEVTIDMGLVPAAGTCGDFTFEVSEVCNEPLPSTYFLVVSVNGGNSDNGYVVVDSLAGETFTVDGIFITQEFAAGTGYNYSIYPVGQPECFINRQSNIVACEPITALELIRFDGEVLEPGNNLFWTTATEEDNDYFILERSLDGVNFSAITEVDAIGNSSVATNYAFLDKDAPIGVSYYRLRAVDIFGVNEIVSQVVELRRNANGGITSVYPIPTNDFITVEYSTPQDSEQLDIRVVDVAGRVLQTLQVEATEGANQWQVDLRSLPVGVYFIGVSNGEQPEEIARVIKD